MLEAINYIGNVSKKIVTIDKIAIYLNIVIYLIYLNNGGASNWDKESVEANLKEMQTKGIIDASYKSFDSIFVRLSQFFDHTGWCLYYTSGRLWHVSATANPVIPTHISDLAIATLNIGSFVTHCTPHPFYSSSVSSSSFSSQLDSLEAKLCDTIMAMESFFMDELQTINNELLTSPKSKTL